MHETAITIAADGIVRAAPSGRLAGEVARAMGRRLRDTASRPGARWLIDLRGVTFIDSLALGEIAALARAVRDRDGKVVLCAPAPGVRRVLEITCLHHVLDIAQDEASALSWLRLAGGACDTPVEGEAP